MLFRSQRQGAGSRQTAAYRALIAIAEEVVAGARTALDDTAAMRGKDPLTALNIKALREAIAHYCALGARVIGQGRRRVLDGEQMPTSEKIYSIFESHTDLIKRDKVSAGGGGSATPIRASCPTPPPIRRATP